MKKILFLILILLPFFSCAADAKREFSETAALIDSLFSPEFEGEFKRDDVEKILSQIEEFGMIEESNKLFEFIINNEKYGHLGVRTAVTLKIPEFLAFLDQNGTSLNQWSFEVLSRTLNWNLGITDSVTHHAYNSDILDKLIPIALEAHDNEIRDMVYNVLVAIGTYNQVRLLEVVFHEETNRGLRAGMICAFLRFKDDVFDHIIRNEIIEHFDSWTINYIVRQGIQFYNRHDFLPLLYSLQTELENETDVRKIEDAKRTLERLNEVIPYLEQKKAEGVKPGLPLDWGVVD
ncbi:hypothetical protein QA601_16275 [Chitinispirillales bacterium ANBcel5]|uniref:hypothetical protein n=1 Tax=Cellulosispirillum alkaliphilum TaxID=3039283 RepID=UPI002A54CB00|nr:hypothetical protein [Chitinispirillales bacterium ANBcel5]